LAVVAVEYWPSRNYALKMLRNLILDTPENIKLKIVGRAKG
jgi:hypothetical protein